MLVLTRKLGEAIFIGDDIRLSVVGIHGGQVRLGIVAPAKIAIVRSELLSEDWGADLKGPSPESPIQDANGDHAADHVC
jgi:carbon storage regulator